MCEDIFGPVVSLHVYPDGAWEKTLLLVDDTSPYVLTGRYSRMTVRRFTSNGPTPLHGWDFIRERQTYGSGRRATAVRWWQSQRHE